VRVQAFEAAAPLGAADAGVERGAAVRAGCAGGELVTDPPLLLVRRGEAGCELRVGGDRLRPALDAAGGLEPGERRDEGR
jgi:hypothetical protein